MNLKRFVSFMLMGMITSTILSQSIINVEDISQPNDVYLNSKDSAMVIVRSHKSIDLIFSLSLGGQSKKPQPINPSRFIIDASDDGVYSFVFPTGGKFSDLILTIATPEGASVPVEIALGPKQVKTFKVTRPFNFIVEKCYVRHRDRAMEETKKGNYQEALEELRLASKCFDKDSVENETNIRNVNSLIKYRRDGDAAYEKGDYQEASKCYAEIQLLNPSDSFTGKRYKECLEFLIYECNSLFSKAEQNYKNRNYDDAIEGFNDVIKKAQYLDYDNKNKFTSYATEWLALVKSDSFDMYEKKERRTAFKNSLTFEYRKDTWIGFSYCSLTQDKKDKSGGFIQIDLNPMIFEEIRSSCKYGDTEFAEINLAFGPTRKLFKYVWIHYGPGATFKFYHGSYQGEMYPEIGYGESSLLDTKAMGEDISLPKDIIPEKYETGWKKTNMALAVSPVVGIDLKLQFFVLRLTYQYRFATKAKLTDFVGRHRISVGVGIAF